MRSGEQVLTDDVGADRRTGQVAVLVDLVGGRIGPGRSVALTGRLSGRGDEGRRRCVVVVRFDDLDDGDGDVVRGAAREGQVDEGVDALADALRLAHDPLDRAVLQDRVQAVRAEQPAFAGFDVELREVQFRARVDVAEDPHEDVLMRVGLRFLGPEPSFLDEALDERVIRGDLLEDAVLEAVGP